MHFIPPPVVHMLISSALAHPSIKSQSVCFSLNHVDWQTNRSENLYGERWRLQWGYSFCAECINNCLLMHGYHKAYKRWHKERKESYFLGLNETKGNYCWVMLVSGRLPLRSSKTPQRVSAKQNKMFEFHLRNDLDLLRAELNFCRDRSGCRSGWTETDHRGRN